MPGEPGSFNQSGLEIDGIRPYRTYYYVLAPIDSSGNENTIDLPDGNILKVQIYDQWWDYNQHLILRNQNLQNPRSAFNGCKIC